MLFFFCSDIELNYLLPQAQKNISFTLYSQPSFLNAYRTNKHFCYITSLVGIYIQWGNNIIWAMPVHRGICIAFLFSFFFSEGNV